MPDDDEEKRKKMRIRIDRDAYSVLLSFKDGAKPKQVEQRMDETLGYTYNSKYHLAGVYDMSQILREHPQVRPTADGKFKIIANEDNKELVELISKQKDNKKRKGNAARGGRRPATSMGYHHHNRNGFGQGLTLKSSPKANNGMRPLSSMAKYYHQKPPSSTSTVSRPPLSIANPRFSLLLPKFGVPNNAANRSLPLGNAQKTNAGSARSSPPPNPFPGQRPLMRVPTTSSVANSSISLDSTWSDATLVQSSASSSPTRPPGNMPSIKEFTDNTKRMLINIHPKSIHLSEMTDLYSQEYGVTVEPLQLFSKSWMNLVKTSFKEWLQMVEEEVSLKPDWFKKYGASMKRTIAPKELTVKQPAATPKPNRTVVIPAPYAPVLKTNVASEQFDPFSPSNPTLPSIQGFRYQIPQPPKTMEVTHKMKGLTIGSRQVSRNAERLPGLRKSPENPPVLVKATENSVSKMELHSFDAKPSSTRQSPSEPVKRDFPTHSSSAAPHYDARQLRNLKFVEKSKELVDGVDTALNDNPQLKKFVKKTSKSSWKPKEISSDMCISSRPEANMQASATISRVSDQVRSSPTMEPLRTRSTGTLRSGVRMFGQALNDVLKQDEPKQKTPPRRSQQSFYTVPSVATPTAPPTEKTDSDDGWGSPAPSNKRLEARTILVLHRLTMEFQAPVHQTVTRKLLLPPMSKGSSKNQCRSRSTSICKSISSQDGVLLEKALHATLPDDDFW